MNRLRRGTTLAALVALAAVFVGTWALLRSSLPDLAGPPSVRPITPESLPHDRPLLLAWEGGDPPYRVLLFGEGPEPLWESPEVPRPLLQVPGGVRSQMLPEKRYVWVVEGRDLHNRPYRSDRFPLFILSPAGVPGPKPT